MSTKRSFNKIVENKGISYVKGIIQNNNCIFQEIDLDNDQGNDCYIEFVSENISTSFCLFAQIKSGKSYRDKNGYKIPTDRAHLEYWKNHLHPVVGIVYDEVRDEAFWGDITTYIENNPKILEQKTHDIRISKDNNLNQISFREFKNHFINFQKEYKNNENFAKSIVLFSEIENPQNCNQGLKSLFSNHRNKKATWFYIITNISKIEETGIHYNIFGMLSNYFDNPHIFLNEDTMLEYSNKEICEYISQQIDRYFGEREVEIAISFTFEGINRGCFSFLIYLVLSQKKEIHIILKGLVLKNLDKPEKRDHYFWLYIHFLQKYNTEKAIIEIEYYLMQYSNDAEIVLFQSMKETLLEGGYISIG
jgi:Domain of unknown function (DUF4365)